MDGYTFLTLVLAACCAPLVAVVVIDWVWDMKEWDTE